MSVAADWMARQLAEFDAEFAMVVLDGRVVAAVGIDEPTRTIVEAFGLGTTTLDVGNLDDGSLDDGRLDVERQPLHVTAVDVPRSSGDGRLVVGRRGEPLAATDVTLLESMARTLGVAVELQASRSVERRLNDELIAQSHRDQLTGLANRRLAIERLEDWARAEPGATAIHVNLDRFKSVNDAYGHAAGDEILRQVAERLSDATRVDDVVARLSSDEFLVLAQSADDDVADELATRVAATSTFTASVGDREIPVTASVGCARHLAGETADEVIANAELAMSRAKALGGGQLVRFDGAMREERTAELALERELRFAVEHGEFDVYFQPVVDLADRSLVGAEALVRWNHPTRGVLAPGSFIDAAETAGIVALVDRVALLRAVAHLEEWDRAGLLASAFRISVNVSAQQFGDPDLAAIVTDLVGRRIDPVRLWLEITETAMMRDVESSLRNMRAIRELGVHLSVDDFGTGWSSLSYLTQFPVESLKIDQTFVAGLCASADDHAIVEATVHLASALGLGVIAEGVETEEQAVELRRLGVRAVQGYLYARPLPAAQFRAQWLERGDGSTAGEPSPA